MCSSSAENRTLPNFGRVFAQRKSQHAKAVGTSGPSIPQGVGTAHSGAYNLLPVWNQTDKKLSRRLST